MDHKETDWHRLESETVFERLQTSPQGLTEVESMHRLKRFGFNELRVARPSALVRFLRQFHNPLVYILLVAAAITTFLSISGQEMWADTIVIIGVVLSRKGRRSAPWKHCRA
jgi:magnesium-transporting ATPase (P-type)